MKFNFDRVILFIVGCCIVSLYSERVVLVLQVGADVVYGIHGVCTIIDIEKRVINRKKLEYYVLEPKEQPGSRFYVPTHNEAAVAKLRPLLTAVQLEELLRPNFFQQDPWITDENARKQKYRELINSGDRGALMSMIRALYAHKEAQMAAGRKFHLCDENFLRDAQKLLSAEFSLVLGIPQSEVNAYIASRLAE